MKIIEITPKVAKSIRAAVRGQRASICIGRSANSAAAGSGTPIIVTEAASAPILAGQPYLKTNFVGGGGVSQNPLHKINASYRGGGGVDRSTQQTQHNTKMKNTSHTARLIKLISAEKTEYAASKNYRKGILEGGAGYNPHESRREDLGKEIARISVLDRAERAANLTANETAEIRAWVNSNKFRSASAADIALLDKKDITLDGLKAAMARHGIA